MITSRSPLPSGVVRSKSSVVRFEAVVKLPMTRRPMEPTPPGAISEATELTIIVARDRAAANGAGQDSALECDAAAAGGRAVGAVGRHQRAGVDLRAAAVEVRAGQDQRPGGRLRQTAAAADRAAIGLGVGVGKRQPGVVGDIAGHRAVLAHPVAQLQRAAVDRCAAAVRVAAGENLRSRAGQDQRQRAAGGADNSARRR